MNQNISFGNTTVRGNNNVVNSGNKQYPSQSDSTPKFVNLTSQDISVYTESGEVLKFPSMGEAICVTVYSPESYKLKSIGKIRITSRREYVAVTGIPKFDTPTNVIVSPTVGEFVYQRKFQYKSTFPNITWYVPDTSPEQVVRDNQGREIGVNALVLYA